jgi:predicted phosphodiesterase
MHAAALRLLRKGTNMPGLCQKLGASEEVVEAVLAALIANGVPITRHGEAVTLSAAPNVVAPDVYLPIIHDNQNGGGEFRFGFITDTHLCSKFQRLDVLNYAYETFVARKIKAVFHAGNLVDGESKVNVHDLLVHGIAEQANYVLDHYPNKPGVTTYYIDGDDHEGWWKQREGVEFGRYLMFEAISHGRNDLKYMGYLENDVPIPLGKTSPFIRIMHPGGGSSYAYSYTSQKIVESFQAGEKPAILLLGHFHKADYCVSRSVHCLQGGCTQDQSTFMRKKRLEAAVGFWIVTVTVDVNGAVSRFVPEFFPFFDRGYYAKRDDIHV